MSLIDDARLTDAEVEGALDPKRWTKGWQERHTCIDYDNRCLECARLVADAATAKVLEAVVEWLRWMEYHHGKDDFAYGGPSSCEYGCLPGSANILGRELQQAGIERPKEAT